VTGCFVTSHFVNVNIRIFLGGGNQIKFKYLPSVVKDVPPPYAASKTCRKYISVYMPNM